MPKVEKKINFDNHPNGIFSLVYKIKNTNYEGELI